MSRGALRPNCSSARSACASSGNPRRNRSKSIRYARIMDTLPQTLSLHCPIIDGDHAVLLQLAGELDVALQSAAPASRIRELVLQLRGYFDAHFENRRRGGVDGAQRLRSHGIPRHRAPERAAALRDVRRRVRGGKLLAPGRC